MFSNLLLKCSPQLGTPELGVLRKLLKALKASERSPESKFA